MAIFIGSVKSSEKVESGLNFIIKSERVFKGNPENSMLFFSCLECMCDWGYEFSVGERYLIYADRNPSGVWGAGACSRTRPIAEASEDLEFLQNLPLEGSGGRLYGSILERDSSIFAPVKGAFVTIEGKGQSYTITTDINGEYELSGVPIGEYRVSFRITEADKEYIGYSRRAYIFDRGCSRVEFSVPWGFRTAPLNKD
jgi:hypothetical protein